MINVNFVLQTLMVPTTGRRGNILKSIQATRLLFIALRIKHGSEDVDLIYCGVPNKKGNKKRGRQSSNSKSRNRVSNSVQKFLFEMKFEMNLELGSKILALFKGFLTII